MSRQTTNISACLIACVLLCPASILLGQQTGRRSGYYDRNRTNRASQADNVAPANAADPADPNAPSPADLRQGLIDNLKQSLNANNNEWTILEPKVLQILQLQAATGDGSAIVSAMRIMGNSSRGITDQQVALILSGSSSLPASTSVAQNRFDSLQEAVNAQAMPAGEIQQKLAAAREARAKARAELNRARQDLIDLLTARQEAVLFELGLLE